MYSAARADLPSDFVCAVETFFVPIHPDARYSFSVNTTRFRAGDWLLVEPSDAFIVSVWTRNNLLTNAGWSLMTEVKTNGSYDWRTPRMSPPWGNRAPYLDCRDDVAAGR